MCGIALLLGNGLKEDDAQRFAAMAASIAPRGESLEQSHFDDALLATSRLKIVDRDHAGGRRDREFVRCLLRSGIVTARFPDLVARAVVFENSRSEDRRDRPAGAFTKVQRFHDLVPFQ